MEQIQEILTEYSEHLPMTARQFSPARRTLRVPERQRAYDRLTETLNRARRARMIEMSDIRDDRAATMGGDGGYDSVEQWWDSVRRRATFYRRPLTEGQPRAVEVWVEAAGMMPMVAAVTGEYGVAVYCSGGFESVGAKHDAAWRIASRESPPPS